METTQQTKAKHFVWYELHTVDAEASMAFYRAVLGWETSSADVPDRNYHYVSAVNTPIGGVLEKAASTMPSASKSAWIGYIGVDDLDAYVNRLTANGGVIHKPSEAIPGVGRFAVCSDPQGALITLFDPAPASRPADLPYGTVGAFAWHDLGTTDWEQAFKFYAALFGWSKGEAINMGPMGTYQVFEVEGTALGAMMTRRDPAMPPGWLYYVNVENADAAVARAQAAGGTLTHGPSEVPGELMVAHFNDPLGAAFGIVAPK